MEETMSDGTGPVLDQVNLVVRDMAATVEFYRRLGVEVPDPGGPWRMHHREAQAGGGPGGVSLEVDSAVSARTGDQSSEGQPVVMLGLRVPDRDAVDRIHADLTGAGYASQQVPFDAFWGSRYAIVEDPDGNPVGLMSPPDAAHRSAPPDPVG